MGTDYVFCVREMGTDHVLWPSSAARLLISLSLHGQERNRRRQALWVLCMLKACPALTPAHRAAPRTIERAGYSLAHYPARQQSLGVLLCRGGLPSVFE